VPRLSGLLKECPELEIHLVMEDRELDLSQREADVAIRMRAPVQADLIQRKLFTVHYHIYATQAYLDAAGAVNALEELPDHTIISYGETAPPEVREVNWLADQVKRLGRHNPKGRIVRINNVTGVLNAALTGLGLVSVPDYVAVQYPELVRVLPDVQGPSFDVHLVYADALRQSKRVAAFRDFLVREAKDWHY
jgi:Transcriptional regulator